MRVQIKPLYRLLIAGTIEVPAAFLRDFFWGAVLIRKLVNRRY
jgi:hypothetical protein